LIISLDALKGLFSSAKVGIFPQSCKKKTKKHSFFSFFHYFIFSFQKNTVPLHRFFSKHYDFSCDGELSNKVLTT